MFLGVFGGEKSIATTLEILRAQEVDATDDGVNEKTEKHENALIDFGHVR